MADHPAISERRVERAGPDGALADRDRVAVEAPLELRVGGEPAVVLMRTPGDDDELVTGFLVGEGMATEAADLGVIERPEPPGPGGAAVLDLVGSRLARDPGAGRSLYSSSSCGVCGKASLADLAIGAPPVRSGLEIARRALASLPDRLRAAQEVFAETGGLHAAGAFTAEGELLAVREDVGRHNAVDKLVGWGVWTGRMPMADAVLCVSGRLSFEIVQKAIAAGFPVVAAVSAPSSLAVDLAERYRVTLCGFVRGERFNIYSHPARVA